MRTLLRPYWLSDGGAAYPGAVNEFSLAVPPASLKEGEVVPRG